jgi:hypothetical protein
MMKKEVKKRPKNVVGTMSPKPTVARVSIAK